ncbi:hypothetical protein LHK_01131 [Laribacter hongkongensis HLHK9]|uniref:Uncharacterized protein n=1 Tax=Laribacter hongkongensis (strain HLHK9) TaxID=557598 RepID=C1D6L7_LARHH|nr:hypothetical protein LHK_01131 [Laribacter hongkongensis HLHK9]
MKYLLFLLQYFQNIPTKIQTSANKQKHEQDLSVSFLDH